MDRKQLEQIKTRLDRGTWRMAEIIHPRDLNKLLYQAMSIQELCLCEQNTLILKENTLYRFTAKPNCKACQALKT